MIFYKIKNHRNDETEMIIMKKRIKVEIKGDINCPPCGICAGLCRSGVIKMTANGPIWEKQDDCTGCGICEIYCAAGNIIIEGKKRKEKEVIPIKAVKKITREQKIALDKWLSSSLNFLKGQTIFLSGNEAIALGAFLGGLNNFEGYPITPATTIMLKIFEMMHKLGMASFDIIEDDGILFISAIPPKPDKGIVENLQDELIKDGVFFIHIDGFGGIAQNMLEDETADNGNAELLKSISNFLISKWTFVQSGSEVTAINQAIGASLIASARSMTATSGPGFSLMQEGRGYAIATRACFVLVNIMRVGPSTGIATLPGQSDIWAAIYGPHGDHYSVVYYPYSSQECLEITMRAFKLSEELGVPITVITDGLIGQGSEKVIIPMEFDATNRPEKRHFRTTGLVHDESGLPITDPAGVQKYQEELLEKVTRNKDKITLTVEYRTGNAEIVVIAAGIVAREAEDAIDRAREKGIPVGMLRPISISPLVLDFPEMTKIIFVPEMNQQGQLAGEVKKHLYGKLSLPIRQYNQTDGQPITSDKILSEIEKIWNWKEMEAGK